MYVCMLYVKYILKYACMYELICMYVSMLYV